MEKKDNFLEELKNWGNILREEWKKFKKKNTYLVHDYKQELLSKLNRGPKVRWYQKIYMLFHGYQYLKTLQLKDLKQEIITYNENFVRNRLDLFKTFFDGKDDGLKFPLDADQRLAVVRDDKYNLVVAGAGSGKTGVLTSRIAYLIRREDKVNPERILALAYTRVAAREMEERLKKTFKIDVNISTFHSLGMKIIRNETGRKPELIFDGSTNKIKQQIEQIFNDVMQDQEYLKLVMRYFIFLDDLDVNEESFPDKLLYYKYMRNKRYTTLNGIEVKSISERDIGNFLFMNGIKFEYEAVVDWVDKDEGDERKYRPDFYLPEWDVYIEHWGLNKQNQVPKWFTKSSKEYLEQRNWKITQFKKHGKLLVETWDHERQDGILLDALKERLKKTIPDIILEPVPANELIERIDASREKRKNIVRLIISFITTAKANYLKVKDIEKRVKSRKFSEKQRKFGQIALEVYKRYQGFLKDHGAIDYNDMINFAIDLVKNNLEKYQHMYDHILVDEFQDISYQRMELIKTFVIDNPTTKLFCVGDDWQTIYEFTGSDIHFFLNFREFFPNPSITNLHQNYRCSAPIVEMSNSLIKLNKNQRVKEVNAINKDGLAPVFFEFSSKFSKNFQYRKTHYYKLIKYLIDKGINSKDIMVLSRFNKNLKALEIYCGAKGINTEDKHGGVRFYSVHKSKGSESHHVIIIDVISGKFGFPCEIEDSSVIKMARRFESKNFIEEERRLFYVGLTRTKKYLYIFSVEGERSIFIDEIATHLKKIHVKDDQVWNDAIPNYLDMYLLDKKPDPPIFCPNCGRLLREINGRYGRFLGCSGYPKCKYTFSFAKNDKKMMDESSSHGGKHQDVLRCPKCGGVMEKRWGKYGPFYGCSNYPKCRYTCDPRKIR
ncbi:MAG: UvrD-helicase domain-containing protein [Promethearchaeota archaeon]